MRDIGKRDRQEIRECSHTIFDANNELLAIAELMDVKHNAGLASILNRISERIARADCNLPLSCFYESQPGENGDE